jgi:hypothetical protein
MKTFTRLFLAVALVGLGSFAQAQSATRNGVVIETFTGTWCQYCPGAAMAVDDLILNGKKVAPVKFHVGDNYETTESTSRDTYYNVGGYPTSWFDGKSDVAGGNTSASIYGVYLPEYNAAIAAATPFNVSATTSLTNNDLTINYTVEQVGAYSAGNLVVHAVVTESNIPDAWLGGLTEVDYVMRKMIPDQNGTAITITQGNTVTGTLNYTLNSAWVKANMEVVVWVQNTSTKEIFNVYRGPLQASQFGVDPAIANFLNPITGQSCATSITPEIVLFNNGNTALTSLTINWTLNGTPGTFNWTGNLPYYTYQIVTLPVQNFTPQANNTLTFSVSNPNSGATDENSANNALATSTWQNVSAAYVPGSYSLELQLDDYGSETTWRFVDGSGNTVLSGGPYPDGNRQLINQNVSLTGNGCVSFIIEDSYGDGICCQYGPGFFNVKDPQNNVVLTGSNFGSGLDKSWNLDPNAVSNDQAIDGLVSVFPNPTTGRFVVSLSEGLSGVTKISVMSMEGKLIFSDVTEMNTFEGNLDGLSKGMYFVKVENANGVTTKKLTKE